MRKLLLFSCFLFVILISTNVSHATYDSTTGRWLQRDPLGVNPVGGKENPFRIKNQYTDGFCLYKYGKSNPLKSFDFQGLLSYGPIIPIIPIILENKNSACCKINVTRTGTIPCMPIGFVPPERCVNYTVTTCKQVTIGKKPEDSARKACKCRYLLDKNVSVYDSHEGPCCWCDVSLKVELWEGTPLPHMWVAVNCNEAGLSYTLEAGIHPGHLAFKDKDRIGLKISKFRTSCSNAKLIYDIFEDMSYQFNICTMNCWQYANEMERVIRNLCP